jgi:ribosomal-protein-alanine N-acetyltransferase
MWMYVDEAHIATIATHPEWRGRGVGKLILHNLMREAQRRRAANVTLEVRASNTVAQNLYRKYGFEEVGLRKAYYQDNREDALLMTVTNFTSREYRDRLDALERDLEGGNVKLKWMT